METSQGNNYDDERNPPRSLLVTIIEDAKKAEFRSSASIYRVPQQLRELNENAYTPGLVSIGPFHCKDAHLKAHMQDIKMLYVKSLLSRMTTNGSVVIDKCLAKMEGLIDDAKKYYAEEVQALDKKMLVIDGCFILELLYRHSTKEDRRNDPILGNSFTFFSVQDDLLLLENQLPFFVLEELFALTVADISNHRSVNCYILKFFSEMLKFDGENGPKKDGRGKFHRHILHLLHNCCIPDEREDPSQVKKERCKREDPSQVNQECGIPGDSEAPSQLKQGCLIPLSCCNPLQKPAKFTKSAVDMDYAGIKFETPSTGIGLFNINFKEHQCPLSLCRRARFEIPNLLIDDSTETLFRNFIALEQGCHGVLRYFSSYAFLMDTLINTPDDVAVLQKAGVICNCLGAQKDATDLFNKLCKGVDARYVYFDEAYKKAVGYSDKGWPNAIAYLRRKYFATPWTFIAFCVALILFGITVTQFIRSFLR